MTGSLSFDREIEVCSGATAKVGALLGGLGTGFTTLHNLAQTPQGAFATAVVAATCAVVASFGLNAYSDLSLLDEGFLWYGAQRTYVGDVPFRDFQSYDPGRYYWSAAIMWLVGDDGIIALRLAIAAVQWVGLGMLGWLVGRTTGSAPLVAWAVMLATVWMFPRHKLFDMTASIMLVLTTSLLLQHRIARYYFLGGVAVGIGAIVGRNHGAYGAVSQLVTIALSVWAAGGRAAIAALGAWGLGILIGYFPMVLMLGYVPGFLEAFVENFLFLMHFPADLYSVSTPWPWRLDYTDLDSAGLKQAALGLVLVAMMAYPALVLVLTLFGSIPKSRGSALWSAAILCLVYSHHALSRADASHLAQSIMPLLIGISILGAATGRRSRYVWGCGIGLASILSIFLALPEHPGYRAKVAGTWLPAEVGVDRLLVSPETANEIAWLHSVRARFLEEGKSLYVTPLWPGAYPVLDMAAPNQEVYALYPRTIAFEKRELERLRSANLGLVILTDRSVDQNDLQRFQATHPLLYRFVRENFSQLEVPAPYPWLKVFRARSYPDNS